MTTISQEQHKLSSSDSVVELFIIDGTSIPGGTVYRLAPDSLPDGSPIQFGGNAFTPFPIVFQGAEQTSTGTQPRPTITISNVFGDFLYAIVNQDDLCNYKVTRIRTMRSHLDDGIDPDTTAIFPPDIYYIENISSMDNQQITWQLTSPIERLGMMLPRRQITKDPSPLTPRGFPGVSRSRLS